MVPASRVVYPAKAAAGPQPRGWLGRLLVAAGIIAFLAAALFFIRTSALRVNSIEVSGARFIAAEGAKEEARSAIRGSRFLIFPRGHFFFLARTEIEARLRAVFPQIATVAIEKKWPRRLGITITERTLWGLLCERPEPGSSPERCSYVDDRGIPYDNFSSVSGWLLPVIFVPPGPEPAAVEPVLFSLFHEAENALAPLGERLLSISSATSSDGGARLELASGWRAIVLPDRPVSEWAHILKTVLEKEIGSRRSELEYVDLRFGNKVFYRYKGRFAPQSLNSNL